MFQERIENRFAQFQQTIEGRFQEQNQKTDKRMIEMEMRLLSRLGFLIVSTSTIAVALLTWLIKL